MTKESQKKGKAKGDLPKDLTAWISGDLENTDQDDYFVSEEESEKRILVILQIFTTFLLIACSILLEKCFDSSSSSVKRRIIFSSNGKVKFNEIAQHTSKILMIFF